MTSKTSDDIKKGRRGTWLEPFMGRMRGGGGGWGGFQMTTSGDTSKRCEAAECAHSNRNQQKFYENLY